MVNLPAIVAPRTGARIETPIMDPTKVASWSPPARGRGSKPELRTMAEPAIQVAPRTGARIETLHVAQVTTDAKVAPRTGARIETGIAQLIGAEIIVAPRTGARIETRRSMTW